MMQNDDQRWRKSIERAAASRAGGNYVVAKDVFKRLERMLSEAKARRQCDTGTCLRDASAQGRDQE